MISPPPGRTRRESGSSPQFARFGQELYVEETIQAAFILLQHRDDPLPAGALSNLVAEKLTHASNITRQRIADKLLQRISAGAVSTFQHELPDASPLQLSMDDLPGFTRRTSSRNHRSKEELAEEMASESLRSRQVLCFARLLSGLKDTMARRDLVYFSAARADTLLCAIAREILYPFFIEQRIPAPYSEESFILANANLLLAPEPILTTGFVAEFAKKVWGFDSERTVSLAMRILRQAGLLMPSHLLGERGRVWAYIYAPHVISLPGLMWGLQEEFGAGDALSWDEIGRSNLARLFVLPENVLHSQLWEAERQGLVGFLSSGNGRKVSLKVRDAEAFVRLLLT